ncbi:hypothetical protein ABFS82_O001500 [Erythranthe guttata]|uniref:Uncharacterized protein n=1 Tax=Erythranthe guttata TaxID=4155 RepID=A0A022RQ88_ERYGU|nr:PREDICTED: uncharacterized protein LOC105952507 [Erythranthe guttata]EYU42224.1 hypothetical protein MIMGU_mgv1a020715mg [Erythranthe guttata]|eukprot:XP_012831523.1 PREDICTED: uncharacterized protein LOC105952507 [Erythranthe guttata]
MARNFRNTTTAFFILFVFFLSATVTATTTTAPTAYEAIESYGFPVGILPKGVTHYDLDTCSGKFNAYLNGSCSFSLEGSYELKYKPEISGYIYKDKLTNLSGVSVKLYFVWLNIVEVKKTSGENLEFSVGIASADFPIINFYVCPNCSNFDHNYVSSI